MSDILVPTTWRERLEELAGRRRDVWLVGALIVVAVLAAVALKSRSAGPRVAPPAGAPEVAAPVAAVPASPLTPPPTSGSTILVHVAGAVRRPGLYEMPAGSRIADAIDLARGPKPTADLNALNLAEPLADGQKIDVPRRGEEVEVAAPTTSLPSGGASPLTCAVIDLNTADKVALETIPRMGPVTAQAIIAYRTEVGAFESIDQLLEVSGIGPATLESMRPYVTV